MSSPVEHLTLHYQVKFPLYVKFFGFYFYGFPSMLLLLHDPFSMMLVNGDYCRFEILTHLIRVNSTSYNN